jgi:hypothetical protein
MGTHPSVISAVDHHDGTQGARPQAVYALERKGKVLGRSPGFHVKPGFEIIENSGSSPHMTGRSQTDLEGVFSLGFETEGLVEGGYLVDAGQGKIKAFRDLYECLPGKVIHLGLNVLQNGDQGRSLKAVLFKDIAN